MSFARFAACALGFTYVSLGLACGAFAQAPNPAPADCSIVGADEVSQILGFTVAEPDETSRSGGICFFPSRGITSEGSASYAIVDDDRVAQRRSYFAVLARRCAGVGPGTPREFVCKTYVQLAQAHDIDEYFASRTGAPDAQAVAGLGDSAVATGEALYVKRGDDVFEVVVRRGDALDRERATTLAKLLLSRVPAHAGPEPSPSPRRRTDS